MLRNVARLIGIVLIPDLLTWKLEQLTVDETHWLARKLGVFDGMHEFLHGFCPCAVDFDLGDEDVEPFVA